MSVLDTFYILFKSNTADLKKGNEEAKKSVKSLETELNKVDTVAADINKTFLDVGRSLSGMAAGALSIHSLFSGFHEVFDYTVGLDLASRTLGVNRAELEAWGYAVERTGGDVKTFESSLMGFAKNLNTTLPDALRALPELADSLSKMSGTRALQYGEMLGLDAATITFLRQGREEVDKLIDTQKKLGLVTDDTAEKAREYNNAWLNARHGLTTAFADVETDVLPILSTLTNKLTDFTLFMQNNTQMMEGALIGLGIIAARVLVPILAIPSLIALGIGAFAYLYDAVMDIVKDPRELTGPNSPSSQKALAEITKQVEDYKKAHNLTEIPGSFDTALSNIQKQVDERQAFLQNANSQITLAAGSPLGAQTGNSVINNGALSRDINVSIGDVVVQTQGTDSLRISSDVSRDLVNQIRQAMSDIDDGVAA